MEELNTQDNLQTTASAAATDTTPVENNSDVQTSDVVTDNEADFDSDLELNEGEDLDLSLHPDDGTQKPEKKIGDVPYNRFSEVNKEKEYWKQQALKNANQAPLEYKTPEQIQREQVAQKYRDQIAELGFVPKEESQKQISELQEKINAIEAKQREEEQTRRVESVKKDLNRQFTELSKKYDGSNGNKFDRVKFMDSVNKNPLYMRALQNGFPVEDIFILTNKYEWASGITTQKGNPTENVAATAADTGGEPDFNKMDAQQLREYIAKKNGR